MAQFGSSFLLSQSNDSNYEVLRKSHFHVDIQGIDSVLACQSVTLPKIEFDTVEVFYYNDRVKVASKPNPSDMSIELLDFVTPGIVDQIWAWSKQIYDPATSRMGLAAQYKRQARVYLYDPATQLVRTWTCYGVWPKASPAPSDGYSYAEGQELVRIALDLSVDRATLDNLSSSNLLA